MHKKNTTINILPEVLVISSYPPRECGIATFTQDLLSALQHKFSHSFTMRVCAVEAAHEHFDYPPEVKYVLNSASVQAYHDLAEAINIDTDIQIVLLQHEFGFFHALPDDHFQSFLQQIKKPLIIAFHTIFSQATPVLKLKVENMIKACDSVVVMTKNAAQILIMEYAVPKAKIWTIAHGIHLVPHLGRNALKNKYRLQGRMVLSTFGLISSGKSIETTLDALPGIILHHPEVCFLIIGKTHPSVVQNEGEQYRQMLEAKVKANALERHVRFINQYLPLEDLLEYLQLTDIYLFTSKDPNQAVSGTFSYAVSCGCAIISTPIPHARELLRDDAGILVDFQQAEQIVTAVNHLIVDKPLRKKLVNNGLQRVIFAAWENAAIAHARMFSALAPNAIHLSYNLPQINLGHLKKMTTPFGMIQFSKNNHPDQRSGYTIDDNARAMVAMCMHFELFLSKRDLSAIKTYLNFILHCQQEDGSFLNYVDVTERFTAQNKAVDLGDSNGRAIWALGYLLSIHHLLPPSFVQTAADILHRALPHIESIYSTRSMAFAIKGLHYALKRNPDPEILALLITLSDRLVQMYRHESEPNWQWFESYFTYGNSILPEAMLCAGLSTGNPLYQGIAKSTFDFLLKNTFSQEGIKVIPNNGWMQKGTQKADFGEQPIDVAYTVSALNLFYEVFKTTDYQTKIPIAFNWFLGQNHLNQIIYNPCTGGCYDGLEETQVNINQGAESTVSYLIARLAMEKMPVNQD